MRQAIVNNGVVESVIDAPDGFAVTGRTLVPCDESVGRLDTWDGTAFTKYAGDNTPRTRFAPYEFLNLFTVAERAAFYASPDSTVKDSITKVTAIITYVDTTDQQTIDLVNYLVYSGLLTSERAAQVLAGVPHGE